MEVYFYFYFIDYRKILCCIWIIPYISYILTRGVDSTRQLGKMFGSDITYVVPSYQRGYSWQPKQVTEFLQDLKRSYNNKNNLQTHFFGTMLTTNPNNVPDKKTRIIDGQQRMTTATLFLSCARNFFYSHKDDSTQARARYEDLEEYIPSSLKSDLNSNRSILTLSKSNKDFFRSILQHRSIASNPDSVEWDANDSNRLLNSAYLKIRDWLNEQINPPTSSKTNELPLETAITLISDFVTTLFTKFFIYNIVCDDESEAHKIFDLVNNRGIRLSRADLIKNLIFAELSKNRASDDAIELYDDGWTDMRKHITSKKASAYTLDRFFYHYLLAFYSDKLAEHHKDHARIKLNEVYDSYSDLIENKIVSAPELIDKLRDWSYTFNKLRNPTDNFHKIDNVIHYLKKIRAINEISVYPAIMAGYEIYWKKKEDYKSFEALIMLCFKYHIRIKTIGTSFTVEDYQDQMHHITNSINKQHSIVDIINTLVDDHKYYPRDNVVKTTLKELRITNSQLAVAILEEAEYTHNTKRSPYDVSIEHIMPVTLNKTWIDYIIANNHDINSEDAAKELHRQYLRLLGNQTLLSSKVNNPLSNKHYDEKRKVYEQDKTFAITAAIAKYTVWNAENIAARQGKLADDIIKAIDLKNIISTVKL